MYASRFFADRFSWKKAITLLCLAALAALLLCATLPAAAQTTAHGKWSAMWKSCSADGTVDAQEDDTLYTDDNVYGNIETIDALASAYTGQDPDVDGESGTLTGYFKYTPTTFHDTDDNQDYAPGVSMDSLGHTIPSAPPAPATQSFVVSPTLYTWTYNYGDGATIQATASISQNLLPVTPQTASGEVMITSFKCR